MPSLNAWFQIYLSYLALGFVHVDQDGDMYCWEFNLISGLFAFLCLFVWADGISNVAGVLEEPGSADSSACTKFQV